ncbi:MAG TPA: DUF58 domain-containing protein [Anaerolineae bacterium]|nr:DUF58 domain-containing protein [Anaerolineae bacterium]
MKRLLLLSVLTYLLLLLGLVALDGRILVLVLPLAIYIGAALLYGPREPRLEIARTLSADRVHENANVAVHLAITNAGGALQELLVEDLVPRRLEVIDGETSVLASLQPGATLELSYSVRPRRGGFDFGPVRVTASEYLGLFQRKAILMAPARLSVLPEVLRLKRLAIRPLRTRGYAGPVPARVGGSGVDFFGVREYQLGDPRRWINWRVSARHPRTLFTNEFEQERIADVGLILDARLRSDVRLQDDSLFEYAIRATASLAERFLSDGNRVGLLVYGGALDWTFPGYGKVQRERILRALARAETGDSQVFDNLDYLPTRYFPAQSQLVLVSPLCLDDLPMLIRLRARGYQLLVIRPDPVPMELKLLDQQPGADLAARIVRVERVLLRRKLQQAGIQVVDWKVDQPFDQAIHGSLGRMPHWFRGVGLEA